MGRVSSALGPLEDDARERVVRWAAERYGVAAAGRPPLGGGSAGGGGGQPNGLAGTPTDEEIAAEAPTFDHFAELFNAANPKTDVDKALVAGYWFQSVQGHPSFQAAQLTKELKNLGHAVGNITDALDSNIRRKPARVLQLAKSGSSKQARKTYKLTHEGQVFVQGMIGSTSS